MLVKKWSVKLREIIRTVHAHPDTTFILNQYKIQTDPENINKIIFIRIFFCHDYGWRAIGLIYISLQQSQMKDGSKAASNLQKKTDRA